MIGLLQRVTQASVSIDHTVVGSIDNGILVLIGVEKDDSEKHADRLLERILGYRIFPDTEGRMNRDLVTIKGGMLLVPQFTLAADTRKGTRPGFSTAAMPEQGKQLFEYLVRSARQQYHTVECGRFGADMQVQLVNDGPATFWLQV